MPTLGAIPPDGTAAGSTTRQKGCTRTSCRQGHIHLTTARKRDTGACQGSKVDSGRNLWRLTGVVGDANWSAA